MESQPQKLMLFGCVQHCQFFEEENRQIFQKENVSTNMKGKEIVKDLIRIRISIKFIFFLYTRTHAHREYPISNRCSLKFATNIIHISSERTFLWSKFNQISYSKKKFYLPKLCTVMDNFMRASYSGIY